MSATDINQEPFFKCLDGNTLFTAAYSWIHEDDKSGSEELRTAIGTWPWEEVQSVQTMDEASFPELEHPRCAVFTFSGGQLHVRAPYQTVLNAWRAYRRTYNPRYFNFTTQS